MAPRPSRSGPRWRDLWRPALAALGLALLLRVTVVEPFAVPGGSMTPTLLDGDVVLVSRLAYGLRLPGLDLTLLPLAAPRRGDVVVLRDPRDPSRLLARRVVGLEGDLVELREQQLLVGGVLQPRLAEGEYRYEERDQATGQLRHDTCRRFRQMLALGAMPALAGDGPGPQAEAWARVTAAGAMGHGIIQCRRVRAGRSEGPFGPVPRGHLFVLGDNRDRSNDGRDGGWFVPAEDLLGRGALVAWSWGPGGWWLGRETAPGVRFDRLLKPVE